MSNLIPNLNEFGIHLINKNINQNNVISYLDKSYKINLSCNQITFFVLAKYFPEYIIVDIANKLGIQLAYRGQIISSNWIIQLDTKKIIQYLISLYNSELNKTDNLLEDTSKPKKQTRGKYKKKSIPLVLKRKIWDYWVGESVGKTKCPCCKLSDITQMNFACGHIIPESQGGNLTVQNLKPICGSCNSSMGTQNMHDFINKFGL